MSYFPVVVQYEDRCFPETVNTVDDIRDRVSFIVLKTARQK